MKFKTIIFDFDGTIADTFPKIVQLYTKYHSEFDLPELKIKQINELRNKGIFEIIKSFGISIIKIPAIANKIRDELNKSITSIEMFKGINGVLLNLKNSGYQLGVLSTNSKENLLQFFEYHKINIFDFVHSEKNLFGKSGTLGKLIKDYSLDKSRTIYIGDEVRDIDACKDNGIKIISVIWGFNTKQVLQKNNPDFLVTKPQEILKIINN